MPFGAHVVLYSRDAEADRQFLTDKFGFHSVDAGHGWLIFRLPPAELGFHPADGDSGGELYLLCDDLEAELGRLRQADVELSAVRDAEWGRFTMLHLPGGSEIGLYQPRHPLAIERGE